MFPFSPESSSNAVTSSVVFRKKFANEKILLGNCLELPVREVEGVVTAGSNASLNASFNASSDASSSTSLEERRLFSSSEGLRYGAFNIPNNRVDANNSSSNKSSVGIINAAAASAFDYSSSSDSDATLVGDGAGSKRNSLLSVKRRSLRSKSSTPTTTENSAGKITGNKKDVEGSPSLK